MAITPNSIIRLCNVPIDNTYKNQIYFYTRDAQTEYFTTKTVKTFSDYSYIRKEVDGKVHEGIRVSAHVDELAICNYLMYCNTNYTDKWFYAFVTELVYKNDNCTEIYFEVDAYQTWRFEITVLRSFVVREHSTSDNIGDNLVPESFSFKDYKYADMTTHFTDESLTTWGYLVATTEPLNMEGTSRGKMMSGIYQGLYFYYYHNTMNMNDFLDAVEEQGGDCVQFICAIPKFCVSGNSIGANDEDRANGEGWLYYSGEPATLTFEHEKPPYVQSIDMHPVKNNKCFTSQFFSILVSNNAGEMNEYAIEKFSGENIRFKMYGDVSANPAVTLVPVYYNGIPENFDESISLVGFPQCAFNSDTYKLWLSRNQFSLGVGAVSNVAQVAGGIALTATGAGAGVGVGMITNGAMGIAGTIGDMYAHSKDPNRAHIGSTRSNLLTACKRNMFNVYLKYLRGDLIKIVDDYFTMFGYQTNRVKVPNMSSRPYFNYVQTMNVNITGAIPQNDLRTIKAMFDNGVTFWKPNATVGDYSVDNGYYSATALQEEGE